MSDLALPFAQRVQDLRLGTLHLYALPTPVQDVVSWRGSFLTRPSFAAGDELLQYMTVLLLDKGTQYRDRFAIAEVLENCGAQLGFTSDGTRIRCQGRALRTDLPTILELIAEQLRAPLFSEEEFEKARALLESGLRRSLESTGARASAALAHHLYPNTHPNHDEGLEAQLDQLHRLTVADVQRYHATQFGANAFTMVFTGDVDPDALVPTLETTLADWPASGASPESVLAAATAPVRTEIPMPNKANVDVRMGHVLPLLRTAPDYLALFVGNFILGGNFSARLMNVVRDELGLTYGIHASLAGFAPTHNGHWLIDVTLSQDGIAQGIEATQAELVKFVTDGVTAAELETNQQTLIGTFQVGLATTGGLANSLLVNIERGFGPGYLDTFPQEVAALPLEEVNKAIRRYLDPSRLHLALAGLPDE